MIIDLFNQYILKIIFMLSYKNIINSAFLMDSYPLYNEAFENVLLELFDVINLYKVTNAKDICLEKFSNIDSQITIIDIENLQSADIRFLIKLRLHHSKMKIIINSSRGDPIFKKICFLIGVDGLISKTANRNEIKEFLLGVMQFSNFKSNEFKLKQLNYTDHIASPKYIKMQLTKRELETLYFLLQGKLNTEIAINMGVGVSTIKAHMVSIFRKFGIHNRTGVVSECLEVVQSNSDVNWMNRKP